MKQNRVPLTPVLNMDIQMPDEGKAYLVYRAVENAVPASICIFHDGCWIPQTIWEHMNDTLLATFKGVPICKEDMYISIEDAFAPRPVAGDTVDITLKPTDAEIQAGIEGNHADTLEEKVDKLEDELKQLQKKVNELEAKQYIGVPLQPWVAPVTPVTPGYPTPTPYPATPDYPYPGQPWYTYGAPQIKPGEITCNLEGSVTTTYNLHK